jgi:hypothetical protein
MRDLHAFCSSLFVGDLFLNTQSTAGLLRLAFLPLERFDLIDVPGELHSCKVIHAMLSAFLTECCSRNTAEAVSI